MKAILNILMKWHRMTNIGKNEQIGRSSQDAYLLLLDFAVDGVMLPYVNLYNSHAASRIRGETEGSTSLPPLEFLLVLKTVYMAAGAYDHPRGPLREEPGPNTNMIVVAERHSRVP